VDAVSAVLMRASWMGEFVLDAGTRSRTDFVATFPTRNYFVTGGTATTPFANNCAAPSDTFAGEPATIRFFDREESGGSYREVAFPTSPPPVSNFRCSATAVFGFSGATTAAFAGVSPVLGSQNIALTEGGVSVGSRPNGWVDVTMTSGRTLTSLSTSTRTSISTAATVTGAHAFAGLPVVGFTARTFENGTLACSTGACQGNYGGAFPLKYRRAITP
jgi:hypothetical protein